jgi:hypothetical protein
MSRIEELFQDIAEEFARGNRQEREYSRSEIDTSDLIKDDALLLSTLAGLGTAPVAVPAWLSRFAAGPLNKMYGAVGGDMGKQAINNKQPIFEFSKKINDYVRRQKNADEKMMFQEMKLRNEIKNRPPLGSGSRVGTDVAGRNPMPQTKPPLSVVRGPRGNTNIDVPTQRQLPLENARNTGGVSDTERAMLEFMLPKNPRHRAREVEKVIWNKDRFPKQSDRIAKRRPANAEEVNMIKDFQRRGFYGSGKPKETSDILKQYRKSDEGIMNTSPGKSYMEELGDLRVLEQQTNRKNILQNRVATKQAQQDAGELVDMEVFFKEQAELAELTKLLD